MNKKQSRFKPFKKKNRFYNSDHETHHGFILPTTYMMVGSVIHRVCDAFRDTKQWGLYEEPIERSLSLTITWIGHSSFLIQVGGTNILVDPIFGNPSFLFKRLLPPGIPFDRLPRIDHVLISHNHPDHMDKSTLLALKEKNDFSIFIPCGLGPWFDRRGFIKTCELEWWGHHEIIGDSQGTFIKFTFLPARHWSRRGFFDRNRSLWGSWMIECNGYTIYFAGDTHYSDHFAAIADEFPSIDVAMLPIGPCEPTSFLKDSHMNAEEAGQAFCDLNACHFIPMHWGTFHFGVEPFDLSIKRLSNWWKERAAQVDSKELHILKIGQRVHFNGY